MIILLSCIAYLINDLGYDYPGNNYLPDDVVLLFVILSVSYVGCVVLFGSRHRVTHASLELLYFFFVMSIIVFATNAVQLTPFHPIDQHIVTLEQYFNIDLVKILSWTNHYTNLKKVLAFIYDSLGYQMCFIPICIIAMGYHRLIRQYYFLLLITTLGGFTFYYFFPTTAPASMFDSSLFLQEQIATGLKFKEIHHHLTPTRIDGGLISLPSFHCIWAMICVYLLSPWKIACILLLTYNLLLIISCVLLGWHYPTDIVGAFILLVLAYYSLLLCQRNSVQTKKML